MVKGTRKEKDRQEDSEKTTASLKLCDLEKELYRHKDKWQEYTFKDGPKVLSGEVFIEGHLSVLKRYKGVKRMLPYYLRLVEYYEFLKGD